MGVSVFVSIPHWFFALQLSLSVSLFVGGPPAVLIIPLFSRPADKPRAGMLEASMSFSLSLFAPSCPAFPHLSFCSSLIWRPPQLWWAPARAFRRKHEIHARTRVHLLSHRHAHIVRIFKMLMFDSALIFSSTSVFIRCQNFFFWGGGSLWSDHM